MPSGGCRASILASTKGDSGFAFSHSGESVAARLSQIFWTEAPIESILLGCGTAGSPGSWPAARRCPAWRLAGFCAAGMAWGYLAGPVESLDFLQPGRHTFALYSGLAIAGRHDASRRRSGASGRALAMGSSRSLGRCLGVPARRLRVLGPVAGGFGPVPPPGPASLSSRAAPRPASLGRGSRPDARPARRAAAL